MKILYWIVKMAWYLVITVIATNFWKHFGWWFLFVCAIVLLVGDNFIRKIFLKK